MKIFMFSSPSMANHDLEKSNSSVFAKYYPIYTFTWFNYFVYSFVYGVIYYERTWLLVAMEYYKNIN